MRVAILAGFICFGILLFPGVAHADAPTLLGKRVTDVLPYHYGQVTSERLAVYDQPGDPAPSRWLLSVGTWVSIREQRVVGDQLWYRIDRGGWIPASAVKPATPSSFHGIQVTPGMPLPFGFVVAERLNVRARPGTDADNPPIGELQRYQVVPILGEETAAGEKWYRIGDGRYVHSRYVRRVAPVVRPEGVGPNDRWIEVNLKEQTLAAYEGSRMVYATLISSGLPRWQTVTGLFRIWVKIKAGKMSGGSLQEGTYYYLADVPWTMYFYQGYGLHATYWHDGFGYPRSRGCVNLSPLDAFWLFQWAAPDLGPDQPALRSSPENPGTFVFVHRGTQPEAPPVTLAQLGWLTVPETRVDNTATPLRGGPSYHARLARVID